MFRVFKVDQQNRPHDSRRDLRASGEKLEATEKCKNATMQSCKKKLNMEGKA